MIKNYCKIAGRNLRKHSLYSFINIAGLSIGLSACILIFLFVRHELTYDRHNDNYDQIVRVTTTVLSPESDISFATSPYPLADALLREFPEIESVVRIEPSPTVVRHGKELVQEANFYKADPSIFSVFSFSFLVGDKQQSLNQPNSLVLTEDIARKYFVTPENAIGKTLLCDTVQLKITAVIANLPANSDVKIKGLRSANFSKVTSWMENDFVAYTFVLLKKENGIEGFEQKLQRLSDQHVQPELNGIGAKEYHVRFLAEPLSDVHFSQNKLMDTPKGNKLFNQIFLLLGLFILFIALLNYINLSTAKSAERGKEIGIRKVNGASRLQLVYQFVVESALIIGISWGTAIGLVYLLIPYVNQLLNTQLSFIWQEHVFSLVCILILTNLLASIYPALVLAGYNPIEVLKTNWKKGSKGEILGKGIVVVQFAIAIVLIAGTIIVYRQVQFMVNTDQGFNLNRTVSVRVPADSVNRSAVNSFYKALYQLPDIQLPTISSGILEEDYAMASTFGTSDGQQRELMSNYFFIDPNFMPLFQVQLIEGRNMSYSLSTDKHEAFIVNEAFVNTMGWSTAIGQSLEGFGHKGKVIGVVKNFYYKSMHNLVEPLVMIYNNNPPTFVSMKVPPGKLDQVETIWHEFFPDKIFDYRFLSDNFAAQYRKDEITVYLFGYFTFLAIFISCLGLYGVVRLTVIERLKEIGIRKMLGASIMEITGLLSKGFIKLVSLAIIIAIPISWWAMHNWLEGFAYRIDVDLWIFAVAGLSAMAIALITLGWQSIRAAMANPVKSLREE